ncbi:hypothetical protein [Sphingobacterium sp. GVS05A]|uniref:hypothetical protein n=1 Tax=Sphingobacterium sp. GVS05A TaxID=2862679 RepID=UPI001CC1BCE2|nr:hypothetical protein [Sphingobacterium sp. GVS05A]
MERSSRIAKNSMFLYIRMLFTLMISLYTSRIVLQVLGVADFGIYNVVAGIVIMLTFLNTSLAGVTQRFLTYEIGTGDFARLVKTFHVSLSIHLLLGGLILLLSETIGLWFVCNKLVIAPDRMTAALWVYHLSVLSSLFGIISVPFGALIIAKERMGILATISLVDVLLRLGVVFLLGLFSADKLYLYGVFSCAASLVIIFLYGYVSYRNFKEAHVLKLVWDRQLFREMSVFAGWTVSGNLAVLGVTHGLNVLLNLYFGPAVNAARAIAFQVQNAINGFAGNFQTSLNPQITKSYVISDLNYMHKLICSSSKISFLLLMAISVPLYLEASFVLNLWLGPVPVQTITFIRLTLLTGLISTLSNPLVTAIHATGRIKKFQFWESIALLMILPVSYLFLRWGYPPEIVFVVHLALAVLAQLIRVWIVAPAIQMSYTRYLNNIIGRILVVVIPFLPCVFLVHQFMSPGWLRLLTVSIVSVLFMLVFLYLLGMEQIEKQFVKESIKKWSFIKSN